MVVFAHYPASETRVHREAEALLNRGYEVDIICLREFGMRPEAAFEIVDRARVYRLPVSRFYGGVGYFRQFVEYMAFFLLVMLTLTWLHLRRRYATIQVHNLPDFLVFAAWFPKLLGATLILDLHDLMPEFFAARSGRSIKSWLVRLVIWQELLSCRFADQVITVTQLWRQTLIRRGLPQSKVSVVMNVPDDLVFRRNGRPTSRGDSTFRLFYHGALAKHNGVDLILGAVARLQNECPNLHLCIHSGVTGHQKDELVALANRLGITDRVDFSGELLAVSELPKLIGTADVGLVPYRNDVFADGILPTKLMEYVALGLPVIAARTSAIATYFDDTMVQFFQPGDVEDLTRSIRNLYHDRERLRELARNAEHFNRQHNWTTEGASYVALLGCLSGRV